MHCKIKCHLCQHFTSLLRANILAIQLARSDENAFKGSFSIKHVGIENQGILLEKHMCSHATQWVWRIVLMMVLWFVLTLYFAPKLVLE